MWAGPIEVVLEVKIRLEMAASDTRFCAAIWIISNVEACIMVVNPYFKL
jgi:hypothetical protein